MSEKLSNRDYTLIIDKSGSMSQQDQPGNLSRWLAAKESAMALAAKCEQFDPDGINIYLFSRRFTRFENVTASKVTQIFLENDPSGTTNLADTLKDAFDKYFQRKSAGETKPGGETILVLTDGEPDDQKAVIRVIVEATRRMDNDNELALSLIQIGGDAGATRFLKLVDEQLSAAGAKFDICDTVTADEMEDMSLSELLLKAITD